MSGDGGSIEALRELPGITGLRVRKNGAAPAEIELTITRGASTIPEVIRRLVEASVDVWDCSRQEMSLDEMFRVAFGEGSAPPAQSDEPAVPAGVSS